MKSFAGIKARAWMGWSVFAVVMLAVAWAVVGAQAASPATPSPSQVIAYTVDRAPTLDGEIDEIWSAAQVSTVMLKRGRQGSEPACSLELRVVVPDAAPDAVWLVPMAYPRQFVGTLGLDGVPVTVVDPAGSQQTVISGSAPDFNPGGFVMSLSEPGTYTVRILGRSFEVEVDEQGVWVQFAGLEV